jgi:hypothetical protein
MLIAPQCLDSGGPECLGSAAVIGSLDVKSGGNGGWAGRTGVGYGRVERALEWIPGELGGLRDSRWCLRGLRRAVSTRSNLMAADTQYRLVVRSLVRGKGSLRGLRLLSGTASQSMTEAVSPFERQREMRAISSHGRHC